MKRVLVLGATGSIGKSTLDLCRRHPDLFLTAGVQANSSRKMLDEISCEFNCPSTLTAEEGLEGIERLLDRAKPDIVVNGIAGAAGLIPSRLVLERGIDLALANKETVVMAWPLIKAVSQKSGAAIIPVDSEHSAVFNLIHFCGKNGKDGNIKEIVLTASGGPFRNYTREQLENVTLSDALKHPTWKMGTKITVDSASLANKGLEVIEARRLFDIDTKNISVVIHPESLIHSLVRTGDGILYAQISEPDMRHPIMGALCWPDYVDSGLEKFSLFGKSMTFYEPRRNDFPLLDAATQAAEKGGASTIAFNAADEVAAGGFIDGKIKFLQIADIVQKTLAEDWADEIRDFEDVFEADRRARKSAEAFMEKGGSSF